MIILQRIAPPLWAPDFARHRILLDGPQAEKARKAFAPLLSSLYEQLQRRLDAYVNDPEQCFPEIDAFPCRNNLAGTYYIESETYEVCDEGYRLWIQVRCQEKPSHPDQQERGYDYLGLEAICSLAPGGREAFIDEGFSSSSI
nr:hypothetical protein [uncultured Pseudomonas sp.]